MKTNGDLVDLLHAARRHGVVHDVDTPLPLDHDEALGIQLQVLRRLLEDGEALAGWKVGLSTGRSRDALGAGFRPFGYIRASHALESGSAIPLAPILDCRIEPELCLIMGEPLKGDRVTPEQARRAVRGIAPAFEINEVRVGMRDRPTLFVADGLANWGVVVGKEAAVPDGDIETTVQLFRDGELIERSAPDMPADGPFVALARLCGTLHAFDLGIEEDQRIITGSFGQDRVSRPASYRAEFAGIGAVSATFE